MTDELLLDDFEPEIFYEVWAVGYDLNDEQTDIECLLDYFTDPDAAVTFADSLEMSDLHISSKVPLGSVSIEIETVSTIDDDSINVGTIYKRRIYYYSITADVTVIHGDYQLLEDGSLKIPVGILEAFKDKDTIYIMFNDEANRPILPFKITGECFAEPDENYFVCELVL
jgi:hypothetical protein